MKVQEREERRGEQGKGRTEEKDKLLETAEKKEEEDSGAYERASEILKDQKLSPLSLLRGLVVQPACLPACLTCRLLYRAQGGTVNLPERHQSQRATTGDEAARIAQPPAAPNQELQKARKTALICPLSLSPSLVLPLLCF